MKKGFEPDDRIRSHIMTVLRPRPTSLLNAIFLHLEPQLENTQTDSIISEYTRGEMAGIKDVTLLRSEEKEGLFWLNVSLYGTQTDRRFDCDHAKSGASEIWSKGII